MPNKLATVSRHLACVAVLTIGAALPASAQQAGMTFFVTSAGIGNGGNLGGLAGADNHCQTLAQAAGAGAKTWRAYLSTQPADGKPAINAKIASAPDRGPTPRAQRSQRMWPTCTAPTIS